MNVFYTCDNNYVWLMAISMISLFKSNTKQKSITVYLIGDNISDENKDVLSKIAKDYERECIVIDAPNIEYTENINIGRWPKIALMRLYCAEILPVSIDRIIYLDCDTIIRNDLKELNEIELNSQFVFYGVKDCISDLYKANIGLSKDSNYVNAGVLLINMNELRKINVKQRIEDFIKEYGSIINYADQDILNGVFNNKIQCINPKYDVMTIEFEFDYEEIIKLRKANNYYKKNEIDEAVKNPYIIHYTTNLLTIRPWYINSNHKRKSDFIDIYNDNKYFQVELKNYQFKGIKNVILKIIALFPRNVEIAILGFIHGKMLPIINNRRSKRVI